MKKNNKKQIIELNEFDINQPIPLKDDSCEELSSTHVIQRVDDLFKYFEDVYRVLKKDGVIHLSAPYYTSVRASQDPMHKRSISEATFVYLSKKWREVNKIPYDVKCDLEIVSINHAVSQEYQGKSQETIQYAIQHYWNVVTDIIVILKKI
jgi:ubiquinone/menaquinone biosynthesis C-methylase UbiE